MHSKSRRAHKRDGFWCIMRNWLNSRAKLRFAVGQALGLPSALTRVERKALCIFDCKFNYVFALVGSGFMSNYIIFNRNNRKAFVFNV